MALDDRYALAAIAAQDLATVLQAAANRLPLTADQGLGIKRIVFAVATVMAPRITTAADVAAIGGVLATAAGTVQASGDPRDVAPVLYDAAAASVAAIPTFTSPARTAQATLARMLGECCEAAWLGQAFVSEAQSAFADRQAAVAARKRIADAMDASVDRIAAAQVGQVVVGILGDVARTASEHIATVAADLKPIVRVRTAKSAPSSALAFGLYGDPARATELVARNKVGTSLFMPTSIDALAP